MDTDGRATDVDELRAAVAAAAGRVVALVRSASGTQSIPGSDWTVGDAAAHLAGGLDAYVGYLEGDTEARADLSDLAGGSLARSNAELLTQLPERDPRRLADAIASGTEALLRSTDGMPAAAPVPWHGLTLPVSAFLGAMLGELLVHGLDIARARRVPWPISAAEARLITLSVLPALPVLVDREAAGTVDTTYDVRLRGGGRFSMRFRQGTLTVGVGAAPRADCRLQADPVALLLVLYGRQRQWSAIARGRLLAWGRRPWLALRLRTLLATP
jgi:uncharacterized protein (TIGR03083 family)